jgi:hypothetical protein
MKLKVERKLRVQLKEIKRLNLILTKFQIKNHNFLVVNVDEMSSNSCSKRIIWNGG